MHETPISGPSVAGSTSLQALSDIEAIRRTIALYGQLLDDQNFTAWGELFTEDAVFTSVPGAHLPGATSSATFAGRAAIVAAISAVQQSLAAQWPVLHFGGSPVIDLAGEEAHAWWDFLVVYLKPGGAEIAHAGRYHAELVRQDGQWRFRRRVSIRPGHPLPAGVRPTPPA